MSLLYISSSYLIESCALLCIVALAFSFQLSRLNHSDLVMSTPLDSSSLLNFFFGSLISPLMLSFLLSSVSYLLTYTRLALMDLELSLSAAKAYLLLLNLSSSWFFVYTTASRSEFIGMSLFFSVIV